MSTFKTTLKLSAFLVAGSLVAGAIGVAASGVANAYVFENGACYGQGCEQIPPDTGHWGDRDYDPDPPATIGPANPNALNENPWEPPYADNPWREEIPEEFSSGPYTPEVEVGE